MVACDAGDARIWSTGCAVRRALDGDDLRRRLVVVFGGDGDAGIGGGDERQELCVRRQRTGSGPNARAVTTRTPFTRFIRTGTTSSIRRFPSTICFLTPSSSDSARTPEEGYQRRYDKRRAVEIADIWRRTGCRFRSTSSCRRSTTQS